MQDSKQFYERLLTTYKHNKIRWEGSELLEGFSDLQELKVSQLLSNQEADLARQKQRLNNNTKLEVYALSAVSEIFRKHFEDDIVDIQPMPTPGSMIMYYDDVILKKDEGFTSVLSCMPVGANTRKLSVQLPIVDLTFGTGAESPAGRSLAQHVHLEQQMEILQDLRNAATTKTCKQNGIFNAINNILETVIDGKKFNFVVASPEMSHYIRMSNADIRLITNAFYPTNQALFGHRSNNLARGYVYCPYVPLIVAPNVFQHASCGKETLLTRYGKKLIDPRLYTTLKVTDFKV